jgi:hypothetical protein
MPRRASHISVTGYFLNADGYPRSPASRSYGGSTSPSNEERDHRLGMHDATSAGSRNIGRIVYAGDDIVTCSLIENWLGKANGIT